MMIGASSGDSGLINCAVCKAWKPFTMFNGFGIGNWDKHRKAWRTLWFVNNASLESGRRW